MKHEEMPMRLTVKIGYHYVSEESFNNSVITSISIEYNRILSKFMHCFSCHEMAVTSASAVLQTRFTNHHCLGG